MASSDNLAGLDSWTFRPSFADSWFADAFTRETETLTKALQKSLSGANSETMTSDSMSPFLNLIQPDTTTTTTVSGLSGSDQEVAAPKRQRSTNPPAASGRVSKRKSRASKKSHTTYITADPANFRQMVQQVTGVRLGNAQMSMAPILKPEPQRPGCRLPVGGGCLPTLDTSAFLLDHHHHLQQQFVGPTSAVGGPGLSGPGPLPFAPSSVGMVDAAAGLDFDTFPSFPTLESWKVM